MHSWVGTTPPVQCHHKEWACVSVRRADASDWKYLADWSVQSWPEQLLLQFTEEGRTSEFDDVVRAAHEFSR